MLRLILGRAGTGKTGQILGEIRERVLRREGPSLLIVPEQYSHEAERELSRSCGDTMSLYAEVLSFTRLSHRVAQETGNSARTYVDAGGQLLQLALALEQVGAGLSVYGSAVRSPETMVQLLSALNELRMSRTGADALRAAAAAAQGHLAAKLTDLALLQEAMAALAERTGADSLSRLEVLAEQIPRSEALRGAHVYIDGFTDFTAQERQVIRALWQRERVTVCLSCDPGEDSEVFALSRRTARRLKELAKEDGVECAEETTPAWKKGSPLSALEEHLFGWTDETFDPGDVIRLRAALNPAAECELAAGEILRLVREQGCRWRDIAVAVRGFEDYRGLLSETFRRYGVPLYVTARTDILTRPLPALTAAAYEILSDGWSSESMFAYLKTGLAGISDEERFELENYVLLWSLRGTAWTREEPWRQHPEGFRDKYSDEDEERLRRLDALRRRVAAPLRRLEERSRAAGDARGQCQALADFWDDIGLPERLTARAEELERAGESQTAAEYRQLWERMVSALEQCAAVLGTMSMDRDFFARLFGRMLSQYDVGTIPVALDRVTAGDFDRMRRRSIRHLLILGASDDRLPRPGDGTGVFTDPERDRLRELDIELADSDDALDREFNLIYNVTTLPQESLWVSRPRFSADGKESQPSFLTERLKKLFALPELPGDLAAARRSAPGPALELACAGDPSARAWFEAVPGGAERLDRLAGAARQIRGRLGRDAVRALYGDRIRLTASRVDNFAACRFQYFLRYGLKAKPRESAEFAPPDLGTFLHFLLENVARDTQALGGFARVDDDAIRAMTGKYVEEYVHTALEDYREKSPRFVYLFRRLIDTAERVVLDTARELRLSDFQPLDFELDFSKTDDIPPIAIGEGEDSLILTGVADRVDGWEHDGKLYLRIADYKSGRKTFRLSDVWFGMGLQMLLYLFALEKNGSDHYQGKEIVPAGVLYVPARDVLLRSARPLSDEEIRDEKAKSLKRSGLLLDEAEVLSAMERSETPVFLPVKVKDGKRTGEALATAEQLGQLSAFLDETLRSMAGELRRGSIQANPWFKSPAENACAMCDYRSACQFSEETEGWHYKTSLKAPEFWQRLAGQEGGAEHAAD